MIFNCILPEKATVSQDEANKATSNDSEQIEQSSVKVHVEEKPTEKEFQPVVHEKPTEVEESSAQTVCQIGKPMLMSELQKIPASAMTDEILDTAQEEREEPSEECKFSL